MTAILITSTYSAPDPSKFIKGLFGRSDEGKSKSQSTNTRSYDYSFNGAAFAPPEIQEKIKQMPKDKQKKMEDSKNRKAARERAMEAEKAINPHWAMKEYK